MYLRVTTTDVATGLPNAGWYNLHSLWFMYHLRWALPCASLVFVLVALSVTRHRRAVRITVLLAATAVYFYFFVLSAPRTARWSNAVRGFRRASSPGCPTSSSPAPRSHGWPLDACGPNLPASNLRDELKRVAGHDVTANNARYPFLSAIAGSTLVARRAGI